MRARSARAALLVAICMVASACGATGSEPNLKADRANAHVLITSSLSSGGHARAYLLYVPPGDSAQHPLPLLLIYHGAGDTALNTTSETNLLSLDEQRHNMILAFMQGYDNTWNEGAGDTPAHAAGINDVNFTAAVLAQVESKYGVDMHKVAATGISNGALLTELLGCRLAGSLTLIAPVEGELPVSVSSGCSPTAPIAVYEVHGTSDPIIPYGGGHFSGVGGGTTVLSAPSSAARWAKLDGCSAKTSRSKSGDVVLTGYSGCRKAVTVTLATIQGGQHVWPPDYAQTMTKVMDALSPSRTATNP